MKAVALELMVLAVGLFVGWNVSHSYYSGTNSPVMKVLLHRHGDTLDIRQLDYFGHRPILWEGELQSWQSTQVDLSINP